METVNQQWHSRTTLKNGCCICQPKKRVRAAVAGGWRWVGVACLPKAAPLTPSGTFAMLVTLCAPWVQMRLHVEACHHIVHTLTFWLIKMDSQVQHTWRQQSGKPSCYTVCRKWKCGNLFKPTIHAVFPNCLALKAVHGDCCTDCNI